MSDAEEDPVVKVTMVTVYDTLLKLDKKMDPIPAIVADHETRLRAIEKRLWIWIGSATVLGGCGGYLLNVLLTR